MLVINDLLSIGALRAASDLGCAFLPTCHWPAVVETSGIVRFFRCNGAANVFLGPWFWAGEEVVQLYLSDLETSVEAPVQSLVAFQRVALAPGERRELTFTVTPDMMMLVDDEGRPRLEPGQFRLAVGGCSPGTRGQALGAAEMLTVVIEVV